MGWREMDPATNIAVERGPTTRVGYGEPRLRREDVSTGVGVVGIIVDPSFT